MQLTKYIFLMCILFSLCLHSTFGQKCHYRIDEQDPITNEHIRSILVRIGGLNSFWNINFEQKGTKYLITLHLNKDGKISETATAGTKILCKLNNGKLIEIPLDQDINPIFEAHNNISTNWDLRTSITKEALKQMSESEITLFRVNIGGKDYDSPEPGGNNAARLRKAAECMLTE